MFKIGLTGGIGSGKTLVSDRLAAAGAGVIDSDVMAHRVTAAGGSAIAPIAAAFGAGFISSDGTLDRAKMRERVFGNAAERAKLEAITHPLIRAETTREAERLTQAHVAYLVFAIPLLAESGGNRGRFNRILVVDCTEETQIARVTHRSQLDAAQIRAIIASQASRAQRLAIADDILVNEAKSMEALYREIDALHQRYLSDAQAALSGH
jgi:dephospho-CoA kinase